MMLPRTSARYTVSEGANSAQNQVDANPQYFNRALPPHKPPTPRGRGPDGGTSDSPPARNHVADTTPAPRLRGCAGTDQAHSTNQRLGGVVMRETSHAPTESSRFTLGADANARLHKTRCLRGEGWLTI